MRYQPASGVVALPLRPEPAAVPEARELVQGVLRRWSCAEPVVDDALAVVSELVTNAMLHTDGPIRLELRATGRSIRVEIIDASTAPPWRRWAGATEEHGRGLGIVATLAAAWGYHTRPDGKAVWAELRDPPG